MVFTKTRAKLTCVRRGIRSATERLGCQFNFLQLLLWHIIHNQTLYVHQDSKSVGLRVQAMGDPRVTVGELMGAQPIVDRRQAWPGG